MADYRPMDAGVGARSVDIDAGLRAHMNKVYGTMSVGMIITALAAWAISGLATADAGTAAAQLSNGTFLSDFGVTLYTTPLRWVVMFLPLVMVFAFGAMINRLSAAGAQLFFYVFALAMGVSISWIFLSFTGYSIIQVFLVTSIAFAGLSLYGYTTKKDISGWGSFLIMGVLIFAGLTAYDTQNIKNTYLEHAHHGDQEWLGKAAIMGALNLYLDFINMFMFLLQLLGNRN